MLTSQQEAALRGLAVVAFVLVVAGALFFGTGCAKEVIPPPPSIIRIGDTGSMRPTFVGGEVRVVQKTPFSQLRSGMIVLTWFAGGWHPHRLMYQWLGRWITKGDANPVVDAHQMTEETYGGTITA